MKLKYYLVMIMLIAVMLSGCIDNQNDIKDTNHYLEGNITLTKEILRDIPFGYEGIIFLDSDEYGNVIYVVVANEGSCYNVTLCAYFDNKIMYTSTLVNRFINDPSFYIYVDSHKCKFTRIMSDGHVVLRSGRLPLFQIRSDGIFI